MNAARIGVIGLGAVGKAHVGVLLQSPLTTLVAVADPATAARAHAEALGIKAYNDYRAMLETESLDGVVIAAPNAEHLPIALACLERRLAVLIEKPIAETAEAARRICAAATIAHAPVLVGHQRRHNTAVKAARRAINAGLIGTPIIATVMYTQLKPASYFALAWRREKAGGGPILINLIHEIDLVRFLYGEIASLQAVSSNAARGFEVEDTAVVLIRFRNGALGTIGLSDATATPFTWDLASGELDLVARPSQPVKRQMVSSHIFGGSEGAITLPDLRYFSYRGAREPGWMSVLTQETLMVEPANAYRMQIEHFAAVALREATPLVSAEEGLLTLEATLAVKQAALSGRPVLVAGEAGRPGGPETERT